MVLGILLAMNHNCRLLIVYHSQTGHTQAMVEAAVRGAVGETALELRVLRASQAVVADLLWTDTLLLATPENFGYMAGALKDFFDRTFYPCQGLIQGLPYAVMVSAGNDGRGAVAAIERIARGYPFKPVAEPLIARGELTAEHLAECEQLGAALAAGTLMGIF